MEEIKCHGGTKKEEILSFVEKHKGSKIEIHYENNFIERWGDDDIFAYDTSDPKHYKELIETINNHYIHGIKT